MEPRLSQRWWQVGLFTSSEHLEKSSSGTGSSLSCNSNISQEIDTSKMQSTLPERILMSDDTPVNGLDWGFMHLLFSFKKHFVLLMHFKGLFHWNTGFCQIKALWLFRMCDMYDVTCILLGGVAAWVITLLNSSFSFLLTLCIDLWCLSHWPLFLFLLFSLLDCSLICDMWYVIHVMVHLVTHERKIWHMISLNRLRVVLIYDDQFDGCSLWRCWSEPDYTWYLDCWSSFSKIVHT